MKKRLLFDKLVDHLPKKQISLIIGPRQSGKTTLMQQMSDALVKKGERVFFLSLENPSIKEMLDLHPEKLFEVIPHLDENIRNHIFIDEIQYLSNPSNFLKYHYDLNQERLKFIVSGSSSFYIDKKFTDALTGRKRLFRLPTLSFEEMLYFRDRKELLEVLNTGSVPVVYEGEMVRLMIEYLTFGGYPEVVYEPDPEGKKAILSEIATTYVKKDAEEGIIDLHNSIPFTLSFVDKIDNITVCEYGKTTKYTRLEPRSLQDVTITRIKKEENGNVSVIEVAKISEKYNFLTIAIPVENIEGDKYKIHFPSDTTPEL